MRYTYLAQPKMNQNLRWEKRSRLRQSSRSQKELHRWWILVVEARYSLIIKGACQVSCWIVSKTPCLLRKVFPRLRTEFSKQTAGGSPFSRASKSKSRPPRPSCPTTLTICTTIQSKNRSRSITMRLKIAPRRWARGRVVWAWRSGLSACKTC